MEGVVATIATSRTVWRKWLPTIHPTNGSICNVRYKYELELAKWGVKLPRKIQSEMILYFSDLDMHSA